MSRYVIGLTGGIASGKTNLTDALREDGAAVIDADEVSRSLTAPGGEALGAVRNAFGDEMFRGDELDRRSLGALIFSSPRDKKRLEEILHPMIEEKILAQIGTREGIVFLSAPLLYECGYERHCDEVWCAYVPQREQLRRLRARDGLTLREARARISGQWPSLKKARLADEVIRTDGTPEESRERILRLYRDRKEKRLAERTL